MDDRADAAALLPGNAKLLHEPAVAGGNAVPIDRRDHAAAAALFNVRHARAVEFAAAGLL